MTRGCGVQNDDSVGRACHGGGESLEDSNLCGARGPKVLLQHGPAGDIEIGTSRG
jgi:hypothetical protein